ncbi:TPA: hypothetical protein ACF9K4_002761 [Staphylococcus aureus]|uniref:hypothetical protein n=1 Tax=Staphylococcus TaxID=1279 RepID=UPI00044CCC5B|nr:MULTISPECIES: hypothetical protein [Staphylococcus]CAC5966928.1 Uncharacterised protein [Staphylococcus aureus]EUR16376.1 hypothetical protein T686_02747 [Staphylococcus aureus SJUD6056]MDK7754073.1 hypothetical protein [Staphylococcus sp. UMB10092B]HCZ9450660.1 hypothetical protein [Staphylococcus aureus]HDB0487052.1 hypothetical protein [Staphylococcus aureus]
MRMDYKSGEFYDFNIKIMDYSSILKMENIAKYDYVSKINKDWLSVIYNLNAISDREYLLKHGEMLGDIEVYSKSRGNHWYPFVCDIGFNISKTIDYIKNNKAQPIKLNALDFGESDYDLINYEDQGNIEFEVSKEPIIVVPDYITTRESYYPRKNPSYTLLVIDGNHRVSKLLRDEVNEINAYYVSLEELLENDLFITPLDGAFYSQFADLANIFREKNNPKLKHFSRKYYKKSYLKKYFSNYIGVE